MKLTVLGCHGTFPGVNGACSGYLLQDDGLNLLLDCGNGTISRAQRYVRIEDIDGVILSHFHLDHTADAFPLKYALETKMAMGQRIDRKKLLCPAHPTALSRDLSDGNAFDTVNFDERTTALLGGYAVSFAEMKHLIPSFAVIIEGKGRKFVYSGDTGYCERLVAAAANADLLLCESSLLETGGDIALDHHLSAGAAGRIAAAAHVKRLLLTHFWYENDRQKYVEEAGQYFGHAEAAIEMLTYRIGN